MVLTYGVLTGLGASTPLARSRSSRLPARRAVLSGPSDFAASSNSDASASYHALFEVGTVAAAFWSLFSGFTMLVKNAPVGAHASTGASSPWRGPPSLCHARDQSNSIVLLNG